ncbi:uncharacterized protein EKO05_0007303 [Ascochyta rabiei]|uniref:uncharacterized protein n=1 Tax=Didymella rabiei TaxID=5454 RepID=UPI00220024E4|nr:uncharacterized protein EKO05_0007303 [Ascochyta rabiei]UPX16922.1 hypothetical protein EKO05_0007303 [Ascochyta rabiei]
MPTLELPPQIKTEVSLPLLRSIAKHSLKKRASQAVQQAKGTVAAASNEMDFGTLKLADELVGERVLIVSSVAFDFSALDQGGNGVAFLDPRHVPADLLYGTDKVAAKNCAVPESIPVK